MADPSRFTLFQHIFTTGVEPVLMLDDEFLKKHTKVLLRSDEYERVWEVKLDGDKLASGWKEFAADHTLKDGHVLDFRNGGDENFHVSISSRSISSDDTDTEDGYSDDDDDATDADNDDGEGKDDDIVDENIENISVKKHKKPEADSSLCFITARVTRYSLRRDRLDLSKDYNVVSFGEDNKLPEIDLVNEQGRRWTLLLSKNSTSGVFYIRRGWKSFCFANELSQGDRCKFKLVENGKRPVLWLCPHEEEEGPAANEMKMGKDMFSGFAVGGCSKEKSISEDEASTGKEKKKNPSAFLTFKFTPSRYKHGQLYISSAFTRKNDIKSGEIILKDKYGRKWLSYLQIAGRGSVNEWFYLRRGWREMCEANGVKVNDSFVLELIWEDAKPVLKLLSKIENNEKGNQRTRKKRAYETSLEKTPRERQGDERRRFTRASNQNTTNPRKLQRTESKSFTISEQVANVRHGIVDTLNTVRQFRLELETREQNLEASLLEIDALGEKILGISKILNNTLL